MTTTTAENKNNIRSTASSIVKLEEFFSELCKDEIFAVLDVYPEEKSVIIDYNSLEMFDPDLADLLLEKPDETLEAATTSIKNIDPQRKNAQLNVRFSNIRNHVPLRKLRSEYIGKFIAVDGIVRKTDEIHDSQCGSYLGPQYSDASVKKFLNDNGCVYHIYQEDDIFDIIAELLDKQKVIGLFEGRMEFGPRALGNRSIVADARSPHTQSRLNLKIKYRESFRPFAPSVLEEKKDEYFDTESESPYMLLCEYVKPERRKKFELDASLEQNGSDLLAVVNEPRSDVPAITHVDFSARLQTRPKPYFQLLLFQYMPKAVFLP